MSKCNQARFEIKRGTSSSVPRSEIEDEEKLQHEAECSISTKIKNDATPEHDRGRKRR